MVAGGFENGAEIQAGHTQRRQIGQLGFDAHQVAAVKITGVVIEVAAHGRVQHGLVPVRVFDDGAALAFVIPGAREAAVPFAAAEPVHENVIGDGLGKPAGRDESRVVQRDLVRAERRGRQRAATACTGCAAVIKQMAAVVDGKPVKRQAGRVKGHGSFAVMRAVRRGKMIHQDGAVAVHKTGAQHAVGKAEAVGKIKPQPDALPHGQRAKGRTAIEKARIVKSVRGRILVGHNGSPVKV